MAQLAFKLPQDIDVLADIIPRSFIYPDNDSWTIDTEEAESLVDDLKSMQRIYPLLRLIGWVWPPMKDNLLGYKWMEDGQAVGVCNVSRRGGSQQWIIGNVAVLPNYRRRGIARHLVEACLKLAIERGAIMVNLDVIDGNIPAYELYKSLGFVHYTGQYEMSLNHAITPPKRDLPSGYTSQIIPVAAWQTRFEFAKQITPAHVQAFEAVTEDRFKMPYALKKLVPTIAKLMGDRVEIRVVRDTQNQMVAIVRLKMTTKAKGTNALSIQVDAAHTHLQPILLAQTLAKIAEMSPSSRIEAELADWQCFDESLTHFKEVGFEIKSHGHRLGYLVPKN